MTELSSRAALIEALSGMDKTLTAQVEATAAKLSELLLADEAGLSDKQVTENEESFQAYRQLLTRLAEKVQQLTEQREQLAGLPADTPVSAGQQSDIMRLLEDLKKDIPNQVATAVQKSFSELEERLSKLEERAQQSQSSTGDASDHGGSANRTERKPIRSFFHNPIRRKEDKLTYQAHVNQTHPKVRPVVTTATAST